MQDHQTFIDCNCKLTRHDRERAFKFVASTLQLCLGFKPSGMTRKFTHCDSSLLAWHAHAQASQAQTERQQTQKGRNAEGRNADTDNKRQPGR